MTATPLILARGLPGSQPSAQVLDFSTLTVREQFSVVHTTDIFILAHGATVVNIIWLPQGPLIVDDIRAYASESDGGIPEVLSDKLMNSLPLVGASFASSPRTALVLRLIGISYNQVYQIYEPFSEVAFFLFTAQRR
mmetsp:Transcript_82158/g.164190  ORF Transcript_82158/g.164190 Transcript_82158/m.164190 type:complete len:137 (+) Transcript_82158:400-810(+)